MLVGGGADVLERVQHATHRGKQLTPRRSQGHVTRTALEQVEAELVLESGDLGADAGTD